MPIRLPWLCCSRCLAIIPACDSTVTNGTDRAHRVPASFSLYWTSSHYSLLDQHRCALQRIFRSIHVFYSPPFHRPHRFGSTRTGRRSSSCCHFLLGKHRFCRFGYRGVFFWQRFCIGERYFYAGVVPHPVGEPERIRERFPECFVACSGAVGGDDYGSC